MVLVIALLLVIGGAIWLLLRGWGEPKPLDVLATTIPTVLAEETDKLLAHQGDVVVVAMDPEDNPAAHAEIQAFRDRLKQLGHTTVAGVVGIPPQVISGMPVPTYFEALNQYPNATAIVSFIGAPELTEAARARLPRTLPKLIAMSQYPVDPAPLFQMGVLNIIIIARTTKPKIDPVTLKTPREKFEYFYEILHAPAPAAGQ